MRKPPSQPSEWTLGRKSEETRWRQGPAKHRVDLESILLYLVNVQKATPSGLHRAWMTTKYRGSMARKALASISEEGTRVLETYVHDPRNPCHSLSIV